MYNPLYELGRFLRFLGSIFHRPEKMSVYWTETMRNMVDIGITSIPIVAVVAMFMGAVTAVQFAYQLENFAVPLYYIGFIARDITIIEMAPTVTCMILAGKVGSNIASELGNMRITEQIDALEIMGVNTSSFLVGTKILAAIITIPLLVTLASFLGIMGGLIATIASDLAPISEFVRGLRAFFIPFNINIMIIKGFVFSILLSSISCYYGYKVRGGAIEIGKASTKAVVESNIAILIFDFIIAWILL